MASKNINVNEFFFDKWSKSYDKPLFQFWMKRFHKLVLNELKLNKSIKILDISCGTGQLLNKLKWRAKLYGVDISQEMLRVAKRRLGDSAILQKGDVHNLPFKDNTFDYVISTEAFHHYGDQIKALREMNRIVKNKGKVIISDINFLSRQIHWLFERFEPGCVKVNTKREMRELFERAELKPVRQKRNFLFALMTIGVKTNP